MIADALYRDKAQVSCSLLRGAERIPVEVPEGVLDVVARAKPEQKEEDWERLWIFSSGKG